MTMQSQEILRYNHRTFNFLEPLPFDQYLDSLPERPKICGSAHTALWRGYKGLWEIKGKKLYLVKLVAYIGEVDLSLPAWEPVDIDEVDLNYFFPNQNKVFAEWFSGKLSLGPGRLVTNPIDGTDDYRFGKILNLIFQNGVIISKQSVVDKETYSDISWN